MSKKSKRRKINKLKLTIVITVLFLALLSIYEILFSNPNKKGNIKSQETMQNKIIQQMILKIIKALPKSRKIIISSLLFHILQYQII